MCSSVSGLRVSWGRSSATSSATGDTKPLPALHILGALLHDLDFTEGATLKPLVV